MKHQPITLAPIAIFVYNRPIHTRKTLDALSNNELLKDSELYFFSDGPKPDNPNDIDKVKQIRKMIREFQGCRNIEIIVSESNQGLAHSLINGINYVFDRHDKIIVLEDDILVSPGFLEFMNDALALYESEEKVMHVSAYMPPLKGKLPNLALIQQMQCWGWGTWKRAWKNFNEDAHELLNKFDRDSRFVFDYNRSYNFHRMLRRNAENKNDSWAIRWYASIFLNKGLCLNPTRSLTINIGHDSTGTHSYSSNSHVPIMANKINVQKIPIEENTAVRKAMIRQNWKLKIKELIPYFIFLLKKLIRTQ